MITRHEWQIYLKRAIFSSLKDHPAGMCCEHVVLTPFHLYFVFVFHQWVLQAVHGWEPETVGELLLPNSILRQNIQDQPRISLESRSYCDHSKLVTPNGMSWRVNSLVLIRVSVLFSLSFSSFLFFLRARAGWNHCFCYVKATTKESWHLKSCFPHLKSVRLMKCGGCCIKGVFLPRSLYFNISPV